MTTVGENGIHEIEAKSKVNEIQGDSIRVEYVPVSGREESFTGASVVGVSKGVVMSFVTDFSKSEISPGDYRIEFVRSDGSIERQIDLVGEEENYAKVRITNSDSI